MGAKTELSQEQLSLMLGGYDLGSIQAWRPFDRGNDQTNLHLTTDRGQYAFRYYEGRSPEYVEFELDLLEYLGRCAFPAPRPVADQLGRTLQVVEGRAYALFSFLEGDHNEDPNNHRSVAGIVARLNQLTLGYRPAHAELRDTFGPATILSDALQSAPRNESGEAVVTWLKDELRRSLLPAGLPVGACRGDTNSSNFLFVGGEVSAVLDFDQASYSPLITDLANLIAWWAWPDGRALDWTRASDICQSYNDARAVAVEERNALRSALKLMELSGVGWFANDGEFVASAQRRCNFLDGFTDAEFVSRLFL